MRRVTKGAWAAIVAALLATGLCAVSLAKLSAAPPVTTLVGAPRDEAPSRRLVIAEPDDLLVVEAERAYRVSPSLAVTPIEWPAGTRIQTVRSVAWSQGTTSFLFYDRAQKGRLTIVGNRAEVIRYDRPAPIALHVEDGEIEEYSAPQHLSEEGRAIPDNAVEGMLWIDGVTHLLVGERGAHWLIDLDGKVLPMPGGGTSIWAASLTLRGGKTPFLDEHGVAHAYESGVNYLSFRVDEAGELMALPIARGFDEPGVLVTDDHGRRVELTTRKHKLLASTATNVAWAPVATARGPFEFAAFPVGARWLALNEDGSEAVLLDAAGDRFHPEGAAATVAAISGRTLGFWLGALLLLAVGGLGLPLLVKRTQRALAIVDEPPPRADEPGAHGLFLGTLVVPPGVVLGTDRRGRVEVEGACQLRTGSATLDLSSGPLLADYNASTPLVDGDTIYVVGRVETDGAGGPMRASHRKRLVPDGGRYLIGRGTAADFTRHLLRREHAALVGFALLQLGLSLALLVSLGLRPFV